MKRTQDDFLPQEYIEHRQDRRMHFVAIGLLGIVLVGVIAAFVVTQHEWKQIRDIRQQIGLRYQEAASQVRTLESLEAKQEHIAERAALAASLIDRLPRSVILSQFINRMPEGLGLLEFELESILIPPTIEEATGPSHQPTRGRTLQEEQEDPRVSPPSWRTKVSLLGFAPTDVHVSAFLSSLNAFDLLEDVHLEFSEEVELNDLNVRQFRIRADIGPDADCRALESAMLVMQGGHQP